MSQISNFNSCIKLNFAGFIQIALIKHRFLLNGYNPEFNYTMLFV